MSDIVLKNVSPSGVQNVHLRIKALHIEELLSCVKEGIIRDLCKTGCINYGKKWSCPPYSKSFSSIINLKSYDLAIIVMGYIYLDDMNYINNPYQQVKAANMILKSKCEKIARNIENEFNGYSLLSGSCNMCKPCQKKRNLPCKKPSMMRYSLESTGINVEELLEKYCGHKLLWYKRGEKLLYTSVATAILIDSKSSQSKKDIEVLVEKYIEERNKKN